MDSAIYERPQQMGESGMHATNIGLVAACIGLGTGAYAGPLPARMGVSPMFALGPVATIGSGGPRALFWLFAKPCKSLGSDHRCKDNIGGDQEGYTQFYEEPIKLRWQN